MTPYKRSFGLAWLAFWLLVGGTFGYRAITHEATGQAIASIRTAAQGGSSKLGRDPAALKPIEQIQVGERVAYAVNPTEAFDDSLGTAIHPHAWRKIELRPDPHSRVVLLRPEWWVNERVHEDSNTMTISIPEVGIDGEAEILSITPCPRIPAGDGRVVIGTFSHLAQETIRLTIHGVAEPIRCTPNHATWSVEAGNFVEAQALQLGHHVLCRDGMYEVVSIEHLAEPIEVFNLEVFGQHVYQITTGGMLVHNAGAEGSGVGDYHLPGDVPNGYTVVRGGTKPMPTPGEGFSGSFGSQIDEAAAGVPHGTVRTTTAGDIRANGGTVDVQPEPTRSGAINWQHANVREGGSGTVFGEAIPNPVPRRDRIQ